MMRLLVLILLLASSLVASSQGTSTTSPRRHLHRRNIEEHPDQAFQLRRLSSDDSNDSGDSDNDGEDNNDDDNSIFAQAKSRVDQDFSNMWRSSPSEWSQEYWEVFVGLLSIVIVSSLCACIACIVPIWFPAQSTEYSKELDDSNEMSDEAINETREPGAHHDKEITSGQSTAPSKERDANVMINGTREPEANHDEEITSKASWSNPTWFLGKSTAPSKELDENNEMPILDQTVMSSGTYGSGYDTAESLRQKHRPRRKRNLWGEVVSVWTEFFVELGLFTESSRQKDNKPYRKFTERHVPDASAREVSSGLFTESSLQNDDKPYTEFTERYVLDTSAREASSLNTYTAPSPRTLETKSIEYVTVDASSSHEEEPPQKVEKHPTMLV
jgi:hypothetical protein